MTEIREHKKPDSIWLFDYTSLAAMDDCPELMVFLSERDINIIYQGLLNIERFRSRVFTAREDTEYTLATPDQFSEFQAWCSYMKANLGGFEMCNDLLQGIVDQLTALVNKPCCPPGNGTSGSGGAGSTEAPPVSFDENDGDIAVHPGWSASYNAYRKKKCNMAYQIVNNLASDFGALSNIFPSGQTIITLAGILIGALLTPIPFDDILAIAGLILFQPFQATFLFETAGQINSGTEEGTSDYYYFGLICQLVNAANPTEAYDDFRNYFINKVVGERDWIDAEKLYVIGFFDSIWKMDSANKVFNAEPTSYNDTLNCAECQEDAWYNCSFGSVKSSGYATVIIEATLAGDGDYEVAIGVAGAAQEWNTYLDEGAPATPGSVPESMTRWSDQVDAACTVASGDAQWNEVLDHIQVGSYPSITAIAWRSSTPFTMVVQSLSI